MGCELKITKDDILEDLLHFPELVENEIRIAGNKVSRQGVKDLKAKSPKDSGKYASSWSVRTKKEIGDNTTWVLHNKKYYMMVHLLDDGHDEILYGKRTGRRIPGDKHFTNTSIKTGDEFERTIDERLQGIK